MASASCLRCGFFQSAKKSASTPKTNSLTLLISISLAVVLLPTAIALVDDSPESMESSENRRTFDLVDDNVFKTTVEPSVGPIRQQNGEISQRKREFSASRKLAEDCIDHQKSSLVVIRREMRYKFDVATESDRIRSLHVYHNLQGTVEIQDGDITGHVLNVELNAVAESTDLLNEVTVERRVTDVGQGESVIILTVGLKSRASRDVAAGATDDLLFGLAVLFTSAVLLTLCVFAATLCRQQQRRRNLRHVTEAKSARRTPSTSSASGVCRHNDDLENVIWRNTLEYSAMHSDDITGDFDETGFASPTSDVATIHGSRTGSTKLPTTSLLAVTVVTLIATSVGVTSFCSGHVTADVTIRIPGSIKLDAVRLYNNATSSNTPPTPSLIVNHWTRYNETKFYVQDIDIASGSATDIKLRREVQYLFDSMPSESLDSENNIDEIEVYKSNNVFIDDLLQTRTLETTYYATDSKQQTDFFWFRESGLRINVGLQDIDIVPVYEEVEHDGDTEFVVGNPAFKAERELLRNIRRQHCRNPMPDYYSVTLEVVKDRATKASILTCTSDDVMAGRCPVGLSVGDTYLQRSINEPCQKLGSYPTPLKSAVNSIACTDSGSEMLSRLFNVTPAAVRQIRFPPDSCRQATNKCQQCLNQPKCHFDELFLRTCCQLNCYTLFDCKMASSAHCTSQQVECALGDSYRYTLQPIYGDIAHTFRCHLRRRVPDVLYKLWLYVTVPDGRLDTPRVYTDIRPSRRSILTYRQSNTSSASGSSRSYDDIIDIDAGKFKFDDFLTIEFDTQRRFNGDVILTGKEAAADGEQWTHTLDDTISQNVGTTIESDDNSQEGLVHQLSDNVYVTSVVFDEPFAYSTSNWVKDNECAKNVTKFKRVKVPVRSIERRQASQPVNVITNNDPKGPFKYLVKSADNPPQLRIVLTGNASLLRWYFRDKNVTLNRDSRSLQISISTNHTTGKLQLNIEGEMTDCPGYLSLSINPWPTVTSHSVGQLVYYDVLISCPRQFSLTVTLPSNQPSCPSSQCSFECVLDDLTATHRVLLIHHVVNSNRRRPTTNGNYDEQLSSKSPASLSDVAPNNQTNRQLTVKEDASDDVIGHDLLTSTTAALMSLSVVMMSLVTCFEEKRRRWLRSEARRLSADRKSMFFNQLMRDDFRKEIKQRCIFLRRTVRLVCLACKVAWFLLFTFTAGFTVLMFGLRDKVDRLSSAVTGTCTQQRSVALNTSQFLQISSGDEYFAGDFQANAVECLTNIVGENSFNKPNYQKFQNWNDNLLSSDTSTTTAKTTETVDRLLQLQYEAVKEYADRVTAELTLKTRTVVNKYDRILDAVAETNWLLFPLSLFNVTRKQRKMVDLSTHLRSTDACCADCDDEAWQNYNCTLWHRGELSWFLGIFQSEKLHLLARASEDRFLKLKSSLLDRLPVLTISQFEKESQKSFPDNKSLLLTTRWHRFNSSRFFTTTVGLDDIASNLDQSRQPMEESSACIHVTNDFDQLASSIRFDLVKTVFFLLDVLLVFSRCAALITFDRVLATRNDSFHAKFSQPVNTSSEKKPNGISRYETQRDLKTAVESSRQKSFQSLKDAVVNDAVATNTVANATAKKPYLNGELVASRKIGNGDITHPHQTNSRESSKSCGCMMSSSLDGCCAGTGSASLADRLGLCLTLFVQLFVVVRCVDIILWSFMRQCCPHENAFANKLAASDDRRLMSYNDRSNWWQWFTSMESAEYVLVTTSLRPMMKVPGHVMGELFDGSDSWRNVSASLAQRIACLLTAPDFVNDVLLMPSTTQHKTYAHSSVDLIRQMTSIVWNCVMAAILFVTGVQIVQKLVHSLQLHINTACNFSSSTNAIPQSRSEATSKCHGQLELFLASREILTSYDDADRRTDYGINTGLNDGSEAGKSCLQEYPNAIPKPPPRVRFSRNLALPSSVSMTTTMSNDSQNVANYIESETIESIV